jgi:uncharacterized coiled-coil DUF342 family protein
MVQSLEDATRELNVLRDRKDRYETELQQQRRTSDRTVDDLKSSLHDAEQDLASLRSEKGSRHEAATAELEARLQASNLLVERLRSEQRMKPMALLILSNCKRKRSTCCPKSRFYVQPAQITRSGMKCLTA